MNKLFIYLILALFLSSMSCTKPPVDPPTPPIGYNKTNLSVVWYQLFYSDSTLAYFRNPYFSNEDVVFCSDYLLGESNQKPGIGIYNKSTGEKHPAWNFEPGSIEGLNSISDWIITGQNNNLVIFCSGLEIKCFDINTGSLKWEIGDDFLPRINSFGNSTYCADANQSEANLYQINSETGSRKKIFTIHTNNGYEPSLESYSGWIAPWGDSILIFQNRQWNFPESDGKVDIYAYNLESDTVLWLLEDISNDGNSSVRKPNIVNNRLFFQGMKSQHCIDLVSGEIIWEHEYENAGFAMVDNLYADGKLFVRSGDNILAYDSNTGNLLWSIENKYGLQTGGKMDYYQSNLYFTGIDNTDIMFYLPMVFCLNASNGSLVWKGNLVADGAPLYNMKDGVIIDQATGYLYVNDALRIICIDLNKTPLDTSSK